MVNARTRAWTRLTITIAAALFAAVASPATSAPVTDCPLRDWPFGAESPLIDVRLSPAADAVLEQHLPKLLSMFPPSLAGNTTPSFASIVTVSGAAKFSHFSDEKIAQADTALAKVPVTAADRMARCARYDNDRPSFVLPAGHPRVLLFEKITGFRDGPSVDAARTGIEGMAKRNGWALVVTDHGGAINSGTLKRFDVLIWNNVSGDVLTLSQRAALRQYVEHGGGFVAIHGSGGDPTYFWDWYADTLIGARFIGHTGRPQFQSARVVIDDPRRNAIGRELAPGWTMTDEWYSFAANPRATGANVIATLDERSYDPTGFSGEKLRMGEHPIAWTRCVGNGRAFYTAMGHLPATYAEPHVLKLLEQAVSWAAGSGETRCVAGREVPTAH